MCEYVCIIEVLCVFSAGDATEVRVHITHADAAKARDLPMIIARVSLPAGLQPRTDRLRELKQVRPCHYVRVPVRVNERLCSYADGRHCCV